MKKKRLVSIIIVAIFTMLFAMTAFADSTKVVTIGQDLSDEQEAFIIKYFGVDLNEAQVIYVNNQQEREYVGSWIPLEQIGNITISSAYVQPTRSGGIQVKTANLTYVTGNMIASVLSTAGVVNCNVVAAAPFPVSGTGALTGIMIAYQKATGQPLQEEKRDLAIQEFTITQQIAENVKEDEALQIVNAVKTKVIKDNVNGNDRSAVEAAVDEVINNIEQTTIIDNSTTNVDNSETNIDNSTTNVDNSNTVINNGLSDEDRQLLIDLAEAIAQQDYNYEELKETLQRVEENLSNETNITIDIDNSNTIENNIGGDEDEGGMSEEDILSGGDEDDEFAGMEEEFYSDSAEYWGDDEFLDEDEEWEEEEDSILENTNDDMIDYSYQSSTREEDIAIIEENIEEEEDEVIDDGGMYQMDEIIEIFDQDGEETGWDENDNWSDWDDTDEWTDWTEWDDADEQDDWPDWTETDDDIYWDGDDYTDDISDGDWIVEEDGDVYQYDSNTDVPDGDGEGTWPETEDAEDLDDTDEEKLGEDEEEQGEEPEDIEIDDIFRFDLDDDGYAKPGYIVRLFVSAADFEPVDGELVWADAFGESLCSVVLTDSEMTALVPMSDDDLERFGWDEGTEIDVFVPDGAFIFSSELIASFTIGDYYIDEYCEPAAQLDGGISLSAENVDDMRAGETVSVSYSAPEEAVWASFELKNGSAEIGPFTTYSETGFEDVILTLNESGRNELTITFYGAEDEAFESVSIDFNIYEAEAE